MKQSAGILSLKEDIGKKATIINSDNLIALRNISNKLDHVETGQISTFIEKSASHIVTKVKHLNSQSCIEEFTTSSKQINIVVENQMNVEDVELLAVSYFSYNLKSKGLILEVLDHNDTQEVLFLAGLILNQQYEIEFCEQLQVVVKLADQNTLKLQLNQRQGTKLDKKYVLTIKLNQLAEDSSLILNVNF